MGDLQFAKQFLSTLDNKTTKYQPDHVFDPKTFQLRIPYVLPKLSTPPHPPPPKSTPTTAPAPGAEPATPSITLVLKSARNPSMTLTIPSIQPGTTTLQAVKEQVQSYLGGPSVVASTDKIKLLLNKKPIPASKKTVSEALEDSSSSGAAAGEVEVGVMVMGGAPDPPPQVLAPQQDGSVAVPLTGEKAAVTTPMEGVETTTATTQEPVQPGELSGQAVLETSAFWDDLQGFLEQRLRSAEEAVRLRGVFEAAWTSSKAAP